MLEADDEFAFALLFFGDTGAAGFVGGAVELVAGWLAFLLCNVSGAGWLLFLLCNTDNKKQLSKLLLEVWSSDAAASRIKNVPKTAAVVMDGAFYTLVENEAKVV